MRVWMVRAGSDGEREQAALEKGRMIAGWDDTGDFSKISTRQELKQALCEAYGDEINSHTLGSWVGQLWRLTNEMVEGDLVVMPLKNVSPGCVAIGKITGPYSFDESAASGFRHYRNVDWSTNFVSRENLGPDFLASFGALATIFELSNTDAATRLQNLEQYGVDPGAPPTGEAATNEYLAEMAEKVERGLVPETTVRELLGRWNYFRRTANSVEEITTALGRYGLFAVPPITEGGIDDTVRLMGDASNADKPNLIDLTVAEEVSSAQDVNDELSSGEVRYAVSSLPSAKTDVLSVHDTDALSQAVTKMAINQYSQLPVVDSQARLVGALTWQSIAMAWVSGVPSRVRDAMIEPQSVGASEELLQIIPRISEFGYVFVRDAAGQIQGIVTAGDLSKKFGEDHAPMVELDEIEKRLGSHIANRCTDQDLKENGVSVPKYGKTLGTYVRVLEKPALWDKLGWRGVDQEIIVELVDNVRKIRNDVTHFSPDPVTSSEYRMLSSAREILRLMTPDPRRI